MLMREHGDVPETKREGRFPWGALLSSEHGTPSSLSQVFDWQLIQQDEKGFGRYSVTTAGAQHLCMVEVDRETGQVKILKYVMVDDCGVRLNPSVVRGMLMGGMAHGVGTALLEEYVYDDKGQMLTSSYMDYLMPTIMEVPAAEEHEMCTPSPIAPLGVKGVGEGALHTTPAAILCAVNDALDPLGITITEAPMTPLRIWQALQTRASVFGS